MPFALDGSGDPCDSDAHLMLVIFVCITEDDLEFVLVIFIDLGIYDGVDDGGMGIGDDVEPECTFIAEWFVAIIGNLDIDSSAPFEVGHWRQRVMVVGPRLNLNP